MEEPKLPQTQSSSKKRAFGNLPNIQDSNYYKMRAVLEDLRPHFLEVLRTPEFQTCQAASEIQEKLKLMMDIYKEMTSKSTVEKFNNVTQSKPMPSETPSERQSTQPSESKPSGHISEKQQTEDVKTQGSYVVGGSAFGWNFITFPSTKTVYYGRTKEAFRLAKFATK